MSKRLVSAALALSLVGLVGTAIAEEMKTAPKPATGAATTERKGKEAPKKGEPNTAHHNKGKHKHQARHEAGKK